MEGVADRRAKFRCVLVLLQTPEDPAPVIAEATWEGEIAKSDRGIQGFGYDPIFFLPERGLTVAELSEEEKNRHSHRARACQQLLEKIKENL